MEIPLLSGIWKRYLVRKKIRQLRNERLRLINRSCADGIAYDTSTSRFLCPCCLQRICGRKHNRSKIPAVIRAQEQLDAINDQIMQLS